MANEQNIEPFKFKKGQSGNPKGRPRTLAKVLKEIPPDARERIYAILLTALTFRNVREASAYIQAQDSTDFKYGFVLQIAIKSLAGKNGWQALQDILDRLFGKPRISAEVAHTGGIALNIVTDEETKGLIEEGIG